MYDTSNLIKLLFNGKIFTASEKKHWVEAVITKGNKISFTGSYSDAIKLEPQIDEKIDLKGKLMLPGFTDSHLHLLLGGYTLTDINLNSVKSKKEFQNRIKVYLEKNDNTFYKGGGWDHSLFDGKILPDKNWIDEIIPDRPVFLTRMDYHLGLANSKALEIAGISADSNNPIGGVIDKDVITGEPTGILRDSAMALVLNALPNRSKNEKEKALQAALEILKKNGITSVHDISMDGDFEIYEQFFEKGKLTCRINSIPLIEEVSDFSTVKIDDKKYRYYLRRNCVKAFADGSLGASTALFEEPYLNEDTNCGVETEIFSSTKINEITDKADKQNVQLAVHAIGDKAVDNVLTLYQKLNISNENQDRRARIEHAQHIGKNHLQKFYNNSVIASMQPIHLFYDADTIKSKLGEDRFAGSFAINSLINNGVKVIFGSDWPVAETNVMHGISLAVNRKVRGNQFPNGFYLSESISVEDAVKCYTTNSAFASFEEKIKGSIEVGKLADFVVLNKNIFEIDKNDILNIKIAKTIFDGEIIYDADKEE